LNGTVIQESQKSPVVLNQYDFMDYQIRSRSMLAVCAVSIALLIFALRHERPRWGFISPDSVVFCLFGDIAVIIIFNIFVDEFESNFVIILSFFIDISLLATCYVMDRRFRMSQSTANGCLHNLSPLTQMFIGVFFTLIFMVRPGLALFVRFSYWVPQIVFSALQNHERSVSKSFAIASSIARLLFSGAFLYYHPLYQRHFPVIVPVSVWVAVQLVIVYLQDSLSGAFFLPRKYHRKRFDWRNEAPPKHTLCVVCLEYISQDHNFVVTPCRHWFHEGCLKRWMEEHPICPVDRLPLPPFEGQYIGP
jgi:hypothetical protein